MPEINFFWDPVSDNILQERDEAGAVTAEYTAEPGLYGNVISQNQSGVTSQFHVDALGSTLAITNTDQHVTDSRAYTAFGKSTESVGTTQVTAEYVGRRGYYHHTLSNDYTVRARLLSSCVARWLSRDPYYISSMQYCYGLNNAVNRIDPSGLVVPSLEVDAPSYSCARCTGAYVLWQYRVPEQRAARRFTVVQHVITKELWEYCPPDCSGNCQFGGVRTCFDAVWEFLGYIDVELRGRIPVVLDSVADEWKSLVLLGSGDKGCELKGESTTDAVVRAFDYKPELDPNSGQATDAWKKGKRTCGMDDKTGFAVDIEYGYYLTSQPEWWLTPAYQAAVLMLQRSDCCTIPAKSSMTIMAFGGNGLGSTAIIDKTKSDCHRRSDLEIPRL